MYILFVGNINKYVIIMHLICINHNRTRPGFYFCSTNKPISTHYLWKCDWTIMIFLNLMLVMISFTHVFKVFNNISASSWAKTWKRFQIENRFWLETVGFGSVNLLTTALFSTSLEVPLNQIFQMHNIHIILWKVVSHIYHSECIFIFIDNVAESN